MYVAFADGGGPTGTITDTGFYDLNTNGDEVQIFQDWCNTLQ